MNHIRLITTGHNIEMYLYEKKPPVNTGEKIPQPWEEEYFRTGKMPFGAYSRWTPKKKVTPEEREIKRQSNDRKAKNEFRRLVTANFTSKSSFVTLTYKANQTDVNQSKKDFKEFIQRMRRRYGKFKYANVIEFQKRGAVHFHMISDLPYIKNSELADIWGHGFVQIKAIDHVDNIGAYVTKYLGKEIRDKRLENKKKYSTSKGLIRPEEQIITRETAKTILKTYKKNVTYASEYDTDYTGKAHYVEINLLRNKSQSTKLDKIISTMLE